MLRARALLIGSLGVALGGISPAQAADPSMYVSGHLGYSNSSYDMGYVDGSLVSQATAAGAGLAITSTKIRRSDHAWWLEAGYLGSGYFGISASYLDLGKIHPHSDGTISGALGAGPTSIYANIRSRGPAAAILAVIPLSENIEVDARLGLYYGKTTLNTELDTSQGSSPTSQSANSYAGLAGIGASYSIDGHWSARLDVLYVRKTGDAATVGTFDVGVATAGVAYAF